MSIKNRELSQFSSFIYIDDDTKNISLTDSATPFVGIGTTNPQEKLQIAGNVKVDGNLIVDGNFDFDFDDFTLEGNANVNITGIVTAKQFVNDEGILSITDRWDRVENNIYRLIGNVGIGTSEPSEKLDVNGVIKSFKIISTTTESSPFTILNSDVSTNLVQNLNADYLRGGRPGFNNSGDIITVDGTQDLLNKTIINPIVNSEGIRFSGSSGVTVLKASNNASGNLTLPITNGTLVSTGDTGVITSNMIADLNITNNDIAIGASISYTKLNLFNSIVNSDIVNGTISNLKLSNSTISGVSLGSNLFTLTKGNYLTGNNYNGSSNTTWSVDATPTHTLAVSGADKIVARDGSGNFGANTITLVGNLNANNGTVSSRTISVNDGGLNIAGVLRDVNSNVGAAGSVLSSTGSSVQWISPFPVGGIILWSGSIASIPSGWALCNGSNGTPDLRDKFIIGSGGSYSPNTTSTLGGYTGGTNAIYYSLAYIMKI